MGVLLEHGRIALEELIRRIGNGLLHFQGFFLPSQAQGQDHLVLPQRDGVVNGTLDAVDEDLVIVLDDADLRCRLDGDGLADLQVVHFLFKTADSILEILDDLDGHGIIRYLGLGFQLGNRRLVQFLYLFFASLDIELELLEIFQILVVKAVEHGNVLHEGHLLVVQAGLYLVNLGGQRRVGFGQGFTFLEQRADDGQAGKKALVFIVFVFKGFDPLDQVVEQVAGYGRICTLDSRQDAVGKVGNVLLSAAAILDDGVGIDQVDGILDGVDLLPFFRRQAFDLSIELSHFMALIDDGYSRLAFSLPFF